MRSLKTAALMITLVSAPLAAQDEIAFGYSGMSSAQLILDGSSVLAFDQGWYDGAGTHGPDNVNYIAGRVGTAPSDALYRNFFAFNVPGADQMFASAILRVNAETVIAPNGTLLYTLWDVGTPIATLLGGGNGLTGIYADLGSGTGYGGRTFTNGDSNTMVDIVLNADALGAINAAQGGQFAMGGSMFADQMAVVPEPGTVLLVGTALVGLAGFGAVRRRREQGAQAA